MGDPLEDEEPNRTPRNTSLEEDFFIDDTQRVDSPFSQGDGDGNFLGATEDIPSRDPFLLEDAFETQLVNVYEDTQVLDYDGETQVVGDLDCLSWPSDCNPEVSAGESQGTSMTDLLCDTQVVSEHDTANSFDQRQADNVSGEPSDTYRKEEHHSGSAWKPFTALRTEAFRAAGLAARACGTNRSLCPIRSDKSVIDQAKSVQADSPVRNVSDENLVRNVCTEVVENTRIGTPSRSSKAVRKLFMEDIDAEVVHSEANTDQTDDNNNPEFLSSDNYMEGLSYANSEPPGELSQAMALEAVDRFLEQSLMEFDKSIGTGIHTTVKTKTDPGAKGSRDLAKSFKTKHINGVSGVYDWDHNREDEGGGEFFLKKKEAFYNNGDTKKGFLTEPRKRKRSDLKNIESVRDRGDKQQQITSKRNIGVSVFSDPGLMLHKRRATSQSVQFGDEAIHKNLSRDFDEQVNLASEDRLPDIEGSKDIPVVENIGPDTQIAAEAMENLCFEVNLADNSNHSPEKGVGSRTRRTTKKHQSSNKDSSGEQKLAQKRQRASSGGVISRRAKQATSGTIGASNKFSPSSMEQSTSVRNGGSELGRTEQRRMADSNFEENPHSSTEPIKKKRRAGLRSSIHDVDPQHCTELAGHRSGKEKKSSLKDQLGFSVPVARRTRKCSDIKQSKVSETSVDATRKINVPDFRNDRRAAKDKNIKMITIEELKRLRSTWCKQSNLKDGASTASFLDDLNMKGTRSQLLNLQVQKGDGHVKPRLNGEVIPKDASEVRETYQVGKRSIANTLRSSECTEPDNSLEEFPSETAGTSTRPENLQGQKADRHVKPRLNGKSIPKDAIEIRATNQVGKRSVANTSRSSECSEPNNSLKEFRRERTGTPSSTCTTPISCATPINRPSPVCMGDEYNKQSKARLSLVREMNNLVSGSPGSPVEKKELRKRREITAVRVLFSQHLDVDVVKQQKKILSRLGATDASSMSDATHFVADEFVRTRNMLEAIASGKPVVTHLWLESCGQAGCAIDEKNFILRDMRKEKELGFSMPLSLSRACQRPLLQGQKVLVTPNTKPGKDILASLVMAVNGVAVERLGRSVLKGEKFPDDILVLSCEEDYDTCVPFLEKGGAIYSSELLLNGIVKQKLEYERHRLFEDHVKRTRSTVRVKRNGYLPVTKCK